MLQLLAMARVFVKRSVKQLKFRMHHLFFVFLRVPYKVISQHLKDAMASMFSIVARAQMSCLSALEQWQPLQSKQRLRHIAKALALPSLILVGLSLCHNHLSLWLSVIRAL